MTAGDLPDLSEAALDEALEAQDYRRLAHMAVALRSALSTAEQERDTLAKAISQRHGRVWSAVDLARLAECHREDSEALDVTGAETDEHYDAARLAVRNRADAAEAALATAHAMLRQHDTKEHP